MNSQVRHLNLTLPLEKGDDQNAKAIEISKIAKPDWAKATSLRIKELSGGFVNVLLLVTNADTDDSVIVKVFGKGSETFVDRKSEILHMILLHQNGLCAQLYLTFDNGMCYEFIKGVVPSIELIKTPKMAAKIARKLAQFNAVPYTVQGACNIETFVKKNLDMVQEKFKNPAHQKAFDDACGSRINFMEHGYAALRQLTELKCDKIFAHNDLYNCNMIYNPHTDEVTIIDVEIACPGSQAYEIGAFFAMIPTSYESNCDNYPNREYRKYFIKEYLTEYHKVKNRPPPTEQQIEDLLSDAHIGALCMTLTGAAWALYQADVSTLDEDFVKIATNFWLRYQFLKASGDC